MIRLRASTWISGLLLVGCGHGLGPFRAGDPLALAPQSAEQSLASAMEPEIPADPAPAPSDGEFADLFDRMRAGFALPLLDDPRVERQIDWYAARPEHLGRAFERGRRYLHHIVEELEARDMPRELALLPVVESAFDPFARSPRRAVGFWQFIPGTGRRYGLEQNWWLDDRRDVLAATRAALEHLEDLNREFDGDWLLTLAAYNAGPGNVRRAIQRNRRVGRPTDFFQLRLPPETRAYVPKLLALAQIARGPERFGVELPAIPDAPYFDRVDVGGQVDLGRIANLAGIPLEELRALNPAFNRFATAPDGPHELLVPVPARELLLEALTALPASERVRFARYRVRRGDSLYAIARRYGVSIEGLRAVNRLRGSLIRPGQELLLPLPAEATAAARPSLHADRDA